MGELLIHDQAIYDLEYGEGTMRLLHTLVRVLLIQSQLLAYIRGLCHDEAIHDHEYGEGTIRLLHTLVSVLLQKMSADQQTSVVKQA